MRRFCLLWVCVVAAGVLCDVSPAFGASAWWHVTAEPVPSVLTPGTARSEVQEIVAVPGEATSGPLEGLGYSGAFFELYVANKFVGFFANEPLAKELSVPEATKENIQAALEGE